MTSTPPDHISLEKVLETELHTTLAEEEKLYHNLNDQKLAQENQLKDARSSADWLSNALDVTRVVLNSTADVVSVVSSFVDNLSSVMSIHKSDCTLGSLKVSLPSSGPAKQSWESVAETMNTLLNQVENLKMATSSHIKCMDVELETHNMIAQQSQESLVTLTKHIDTLSHSMDHKRSILHPICRMPTEILEHIFQQAAWEERSALRVVRDQIIHLSKSALYLTIPRIPTILASTCRHWRIIALNMTQLWNFLRIPTLEMYYHPPGLDSTRSCVVGRSLFRRALLRIGASKCEVVIGPTNNWNLVIGHLHAVPKSQISAMNIISPPYWYDFSQLPTVRVLRIIRRGAPTSWDLPQPPPSYILPASALASTEELECHHALPAVNAPIHSVRSFSLTINNSALFPDLGHDLANFPNVTALELSTMHTPFTYIYHRKRFTPLHHACINTLSVTDPVIPHLCALLQHEVLSLPSLTHFILLDICPFIHLVQVDPLQSLFDNVTHFDIRTGHQQGCGSYIRRLLNLMPFLQQFSVFGTAVSGGLDALFIEPIKKIDKFVILDSETDGSIVSSYYDALSLKSAESTGGYTGDNLGITIQFVNCPYILPQIRERFPCK